MLCATLWYATTNENQINEMLWDLFVMIWDSNAMRLKRCSML